MEKGNDWKDAMKTLRKLREEHPDDEKHINLALNALARELRALESFDKVARRRMERRRS